MSTDRRPDEHAVDEVVDRAWRSASQDEPPARIDAAILEAARAETRDASERRQAPARRRRWTQWQPLAAAAGVVGLAFVLVQLLPRDEGLRGPPVMERARQYAEPVPRSAPMAVTEGDASPPPAPSDRSTEAPAASSAAPHGVAASAATLPARESALPTPEAWAQHVADLYAAGDADAASAALEAFRAAHPDADEFLPVELRTWASTVPAEDDQ